MNGIGGLETAKKVTFEMMKSAYFHMVRFLQSNDGRILVLVSGLMLAGVAVV